MTKDSLVEVAASFERGDNASAAMGLPAAKIQN
jgi:hypothetical protein